MVCNCDHLLDLTDGKIPQLINVGFDGASLVFSQKKVKTFPSGKSRRGFLVLDSRPAVVDVRSLLLASIG